MAEWKEKTLKCIVKDADGYSTLVDATFKYRFGDEMEVKLVSAKDRNGKKVDVSESERDRLEQECLWWSYKFEFGSRRNEMNKNVKIARELVKLAKMLVAKEWGGGTTCDICHKPITKYLYDAVVDSAWGAWGTMCKHCWEVNGAHLGGGQGQEYVETEPGKFELNRGGMSNKNNHLKPYSAQKAEPRTRSTGGTSAPVESVDLSQYPVGVIYAGDDGAKHYKTTFIRLAGFERNSFIFESITPEIYERRSQFDECDTVVPGSTGTTFKVKASDVTFEDKTIVFAHLVRGVGKSFKEWSGKPLLKGWFYYY